MAFTIPTTLKLAQLKQLAFKCGVLSSGTKPILSQRLHDEITKAASDGTPLQKRKGELTRVLSIDMGIRNLAYCVLELPSQDREKNRQLPVIQSWHRLAVSSAPTILPIDEIVPKASKEVEKESFSPATLSLTAYNLLRKRLLVHKPTHILIERQRFRSMGSKHILEWTIRVNMFESILYGVLCTLQSEGAWTGIVQEIIPGKVTPFWVDPNPGVSIPTPERKVRKTQNAKIKNKSAKIDLVRSWLEAGDVLRLGNEEVEGTARAYREKWARGVGGGKAVRKDDGEKMGKLDDLADSLLQGMAWLTWDENKKIAMKKGVEALLDP